ncbi:hypothetical protein CBER1_08404 [Cercospora berteroae]|uniref:Uncharacterized protein n=1 Tax=Cercospora berteroae TaxID=357750 RepID=A0A2S6BV67_9PEZI|nr:hypothetical protein CBER1_08404 [Cercospora berteroae]
MSSHGEALKHSLAKPPTHGTKRRGEDLDQQYVIYVQEESKHIETTRTKMERIREDRALGLHFHHNQAQIQDGGRLQERDGSWGQTMMGQQWKESKSEKKEEDGDGDSKMGDDTT